MCFGQLTFRDSLRDLTATLDALGSRRYHMGIKTNVPLSTLSYTNANRPWQIYQDLAMVWIAHAQNLHGKDEVTESIKILDSSTIDLCLSLFPWSVFWKQKAAIKIHTMMDLEGSIATLSIFPMARPMM